jgi:phenylacetic acid degradation operon negative regulatory protein
VLAHQSEDTTAAKASTLGLMTTDAYPAKIRPLTARSVVLSTLLGYHPPELPVSALVRAGDLFGIAERSIRVALSRLVADGDLVATNATYRLSPRLVRRQLRQDDSAFPPAKPWHGDWLMAVVTSTARPLADRVALRKAMTDSRYAELREGVWLRPDNLVQSTDELVTEQCTTFSGRYLDPAALARLLWDLDAWNDIALRLTGALTTTPDLRNGFIVIAEVVHHLAHDPILPPLLLPDDWAGTTLRERFVAFRDCYAKRLRDYCAT